MAEKSIPYGPNTVTVRRFLQRLASLSATDEGRAVAEYQRSSANALYQSAERVLGTAIERSGREPERDALGGPLLQMVQRTDAPPTAELAPGVVEDLESITGALRPVAEPALAALLAVMMQDVLSAEQLQRLYAPFEAVIPYASLG